MIIAITSTVCGNTRLTRASQFLRLFNFDVRYRPGKEYIVPDTLSRLANINSIGDLLDNYSELNYLTYIIFTITIKDKLRQRIKNGYQEDPAWSTIVAILDKNKNLAYKNRSILPFTYGRYLLV